MEKIDQQVPDDERIRELIIEQVEQLLPDSLRKTAIQEIDKLVKQTQVTIRYTLENFPDHMISPEEAVKKKLEVWRAEKLSRFSYHRYKELMERQFPKSKICPFKRFRSFPQSARWSRIDNLKIKKGTKVRKIDGSEIFTVKDIDKYLNLVVEETPNHFDPRRVQPLD